MKERILRNMKSWRRPHSPPQLTEPFVAARFPGPPIWVEEQDTAHHPPHGIKHKTSSNRKRTRFFHTFGRRTLNGPGEPATTRRRSYRFFRAFRLRRTSHVEVPDHHDQPVAPPVVSAPELSPALRASNLYKLGNEQFDVLVIGGGVTGAGIALDAAARGYKVALVEKADFASGTSSKSTKLVHGGIRYLPEFDFSLVHEALVERGLLLQNAPFMVSPVAFVLPLYRGDRHPVGMRFTTPGGIGLSMILNMGLWLYDAMAGRRNVRRYRRLSRQDVLKLAPALVTEKLKQGFVYYDAQTNDARLTMTLIRSAAQYGATITNYSEVTSFLIEDGKIRGAYIHDQPGNQELLVHTRHIVNATGIFTEQVESLTGAEPHIQVQPSKGVHLVLSREDVRLGDTAIVLPETEDKRLLFIVPWQSRVIFGTTDTGTGDLDHPIAKQTDISYLLHHLNRYLSVKLTEDNIISTYAGYRPLVRSRRHSGRPSARLSRSYSVLENSSGLVSVVGGKLTTYRRMAQDTVDLLNRRDRLVPHHPTKHLPLQGSAGWPASMHDLQALGTSLDLDAQIMAHLGQSYGSEACVILELVANDSTLAARLVADLPYIRAEVIYTCCREMAMTPYDVLARRTAIMLEDRQRGLGIVDEVAALMVQVHHWSPEKQHALTTAYRNAVLQQMTAEAASL